MITPRRYSLVLFMPFVFVGIVSCTASNRAGDPIASAFTADDWPWWRGLQRNGIAASDQDLPLTWSESENVLWQSDVPGRGHGSPIVVGDQVVLATADEEKEIQSVLCFHRKNGDLLWKTDVHKGGLEKGGNKKASQASTTLACDGERFFVNFLNGDAVHTTALSRAGDQLWQTKISDYVVHQGYGSSPTIYRDLVIVSADNKSGGALCAMNRATGDIVWRVERPEKPNYPSPIILTAGGREQLFLVGCDLIVSFDPLTGEKLWEVEGATTECVTSTVTDGARIFTSGGYPKNHVSAVEADGSKEITWENTVRVYVPSMLVHDGYLYGVADAGIANCWDSATGNEMWKGRLGGTFSSSPVLVGDRIYVTNEVGKTFVFKADPKAFELVAENELAGEVFATPAICSSRIYMRVGRSVAGRRQEVLYCIGQAGR